MKEKGERPWYEEAFEEYYTELYSHRDEREAVQIADLVKLHCPVRGTLVLDLACGAGRHMKALGHLGARPVGLDLSVALLDKAACASHCPLVRADMRWLPFTDGAFGGAISMFTSFGYFSKRDHETMVLREVARCLRPQGWFVLDYLNAEALRRSLEPLSRRRMCDVDVVERRSIDASKGCVIKKVELYRDGSLVKEHTEAVRLLSLQEICGMLMEAGMSPFVFLGSYSGEPYEPSGSPRLIVFCRRNSA